MTETINILVADDSLFMRYLTADILKKAEGFSIVDFARDGKEAVEKCKKLKPDVIVMDMLMGDYDGLYGVEQIMKEVPTPIIILSALGSTDMNPILKALELGAVDYHHKPDRSSKTIAADDEELVAKIKAASYVKVNAIKTAIITVKNNFAHTFSKNLNYDIIVIGSSTGGPSALESVLTRLPENLTVPVLIAQHMPETFVPSFAARLNELIPLEVRMAKKDDEVVAGTILLAPGSRNMVVKQNVDGKVVIDFTSKRFKDYNFPSVTGLMHSVAEVYKSRAIGVILTGMGKDGSEGLKAIHDSGGYTVAQSKETCIVFGMPKEAIEIGAVTKVVPLKEIGPFVVSCLE